MKPKIIGVIGGAGPQAGVALVERIISFCQKLYGCKEDADFPQIILNSIPFSNMLSEKIDSFQIQTELTQGLEQLRSMEAQVLAIACNTLHLFLDEKNAQSTDILQLPQILADKISQLNEPPIVLCTTTSTKSALHKKFFPCVYPDRTTQEEVDALIDLILEEGVHKEAIEKLIEIINTQPEKNVILGCTELSLVKNQLPNLSKEIIDPLDSIALEILKIAFNK